MKATLIDHMGSDLSVVNAARVSFGKTSTEMTKRDEGLIRFLARGCTSGDWERLGNDLVNAGYYAKPEFSELMNHIRRMPPHWTPFGHTAITLHLEAPIFVARQFGKHQVGLVWNEVSRRYVTDVPNVYLPKSFRKAADNVKQGSSDETVDWGREYYIYLTNRCLDLYKDMLEMGICPEQARMVLPQSMYTEWYWTGNLYAFANLYVQRTDSHTQREAQDLAHQIGDLIAPLFPVSWEALTQ